jgi:hypothetical protein
MQEWMKENAPWKDDTGDARAGLTATAVDTGSVIAEIVVSHDPSLAYPIYLERDYQGRYAIIRPTLDYWQPRLQRSLQNIANLKLITKG